MSLGISRLRLGMSSSVEGGSYTPAAVAFDSSTWVDLNANGVPLTTDNDNFVLAARVRRTAASGTQIFFGWASGGLYSSVTDVQQNAVLDRLSAGFYYQGLLRYFGNSADDSFENTEELSLFMRCKSGALEILFDGAAPASTSGSPTATFSNINPPTAINRQSTTTQDGFELIGGLWMSDASGAYDALSYSDFFDGSNQPIFEAATINGIAATFFENGNAAAWNALSGVTGTVTDV